MPRYFMNMYTDEPCMDPDGTDRPNVEVAVAEAERGARDVIAGDIKAGKPVHLSHRIEVVGEDGSVLRVVLFGDIMQVVP